MSALNEHESLQRRIAALEADLDELGSLLLAERERVTLAEDSFARHARLEHDGFIPGEAMAAKRTELLARHASVKLLERERAKAAADLAELEGQLKNLPREQRIRIAELRRAMAMVDQEIAENSARHRVVVMAPVDGVATTVLGSVGQPVDSSRHLVSLVPVDSPLQAELYARTRAVGFVNPGDEVWLRYRAYPYQKFGHYRGSVATVSRKPLPLAQLAGMQLQHQR